MISLVLISKFLSYPVVKLSIPLFQDHLIYGIDQDFKYRRGCDHSRIMDFSGHRSVN